MGWAWCCGSSELASGTVDEELRAAVVAGAVPGLRDWGAFGKRNGGLAGGWKVVKAPPV